MKKFEELGIDERTIKAIRDLGFEKPTEVQEKAIPYVLEGKDIIAESATGSGKTFVFAAGIINNIVPKKKPQAIILTPTRELAEQINNALKKFSKYTKIKTTAVYGGVPIEKQIRSLKTTDVIVATPGRMLDHISRRTVDLSNIKIVILDEADRMLDMGFIDDVKQILSRCPKNRQTLLLSATITREILGLKRKFLKDPVTINAEKQVNKERLKQEYYEVNGREKISLLVKLLEESDELSMVFCNTRKTVDFVTTNLRNNGIKAIAIHGGHTQNKRLKALDDFNNGRVNVLVCTDVAARGLDIKNVKRVFNFDLPKTSKEYIHRIGRTARAGQNGEVTNLLSQQDYDSMSRIMSDYREFEINKRKKPEFKRIQIVHEQRRPERRFSRRRRRF